MNYLITGGTGFIGHNLIGELLEQKKKATIYVLVRKGSKKKLDALKKEWGTGAKRVVPITGDLTKPFLGVPPKKRRELEGKIDHVFHLAAVYDLMADAESQVRVNVEGTQNVVNLAADIKAKRFHHMSSIAAAGLYSGIFREDMFEEAHGLD
ncbi:MAG: SDR family oxidoreductase, partial [Xanthomonadales bacterium]|nr:SDR family oxidoreductase [Xanthomonadales bacterium]